jgi:hypothetical protein
MLVRERHWHEKISYAAISPLTASFLGLAFLALTFSALSPDARGSESLQQVATQQQDTNQKDSEQAKPADTEKSEIAVPLPKGEKLVLSDGSFQMVREYHREGDRVRYYSLERSGWEEIPATMVDWAATEKAKAERETQEKQLDEQIAKTENAERFADLNVDTSFEVRPNVFLPDGTGFYAVDGKSVALVKQEEATLRLEKGRAFERIVTGMPMISARQDMELAGKQAKLRLHSGDLEFYFRTADERDPRLKLIRAQIKDGKRELEVVSTDIAGQQKYKDQEISLLKWDAARGLYRFTLDHPLEAGEYAAIETIETTTSEGQSIYVWTFGVDGNANDAGAKPKQNNPAKK